GLSPGEVSRRSDPCNVARDEFSVCVFGWGRSVLRQRSDGVVVAQELLTADVGPVHHLGLGASQRSRGALDGVASGGISASATPARRALACIAVAEESTHHIAIAHADSPLEWVRCPPAA